MALEPNTRRRGVGEDREVQSLIMKSVGLWLIRPGIIRAVRGHGLGAVAAVGPVVVVAQSSRSVGSGVRRRDVSLSCSRRTSVFRAAVVRVERRDDRHCSALWDRYITYTNSYEH
jgi:hypothetical protein